MYTYVDALVGRASSGWYAQIKRDARAGARQGGDTSISLSLMIYIHTYLGLTRDIDIDIDR